MRDSGGDEAGVEAAAEVDEVIGLLGLGPHGVHGAALPPSTSSGGELASSGRESGGGSGLDEAGVEAAAELDEVSGLLGLGPHGVHGVAVDLELRASVNGVE